MLLLGQSTHQHMKKSACYSLLLSLAGSLFPFLLFAQIDTGQAGYIEKKKGFYHNEILPSITKEKKQAPGTTFRYIPEEDAVLPANPDAFSPIWHTAPKSQGATGTCWAFAATSFLESEINRLKNMEVTLSVMFFVYMDYVERTRHFIETRGDTYFNHGSEANAVTRMMSKYGAIPWQAYPGKHHSDKFHNHKKMMEEMKSYLAHVKETDAWNEEAAVSTIKSIMNKYMGTPPQVFSADGKQYTPASYVEDYLAFHPGHYFSFMSTKSKSFWARGELVEPDNWWHADNYYNLPLKNYYGLIERSIDKGFGVCICGDVSEPGHLSQQEISVIPDFDIPAQYINQDSRELRLNNQSTTDDHCIHLVGQQVIGDEKWFLIKDSGAGGFDGPHAGYRFFHEDYIRLKMMNILVHRDAARPELDRIIKK